MKIGGVEVSGPAEEVLVLPRSNGPDIVFIAEAADMEQFHHLVPKPQAKVAWSKDQGKHQLTDDPDYIEQMKQYETLHFAYMAVKSLAPSDIEWTTVNPEKPNTWDQWTEELKTAGFTDIEVRRIVGLVMAANCLDERRLKEARESFLLGRALGVAGDLSGQEEDQPSTESGTPASDSE